MKQLSVYMEKKVDTLDLPRDVTAKIRRAAKLINELDQLLKYWGEECFIHELNHNSDKTRYRLELVLKSEPPVDECAAVLGDIMHNLRSALDLWMSHQAGATGEEARSLRLQFPICKKGKDFQNWKARVKGLVDEHLIEAIRQRQPYVQNPPHKHWLLGLSDLDNADKHRIMMSVDFGYTDNLNLLASPLPPNQDLPDIIYRSHVVTATSGGVVLDLQSAAPLEVDAQRVTMDAFFELDGTKHELIQNVRGFHDSVQRLLMRIQHQAITERDKID